MLTRVRESPIGRFRFAVAAAVIIAVRGAAAAQTDPLPSWNDGAARRAIMKFVPATTRAGAPAYIPPEQRIATFDNDGTLWAEQPIYFQFALGSDRAKALAPQHPEWKDNLPPNVPATNFWSLTLYEAANAWATRTTSRFPPSVPAASRPWTPTQRGPLRRPEGASGEGSELARDDPRHGLFHDSPALLADGSGDQQLLEARRLRKRELGRRRET
jgi:hypothetical protein